MPVSVAAEGDVDTEVVVVVAAAPVGAGRRDRRAAGRAAARGGFASGAAEDVVGWVQVR